MERTRNLPELLAALDDINNKRRDDSAYVDSGGYVGDFEAVLFEIADLKEPGCIRLLVPYFEDDAPYHELMFSIIHLIERFEDRIYLQELLGAAPSLWKASQEWAPVLFLRVVNSSSSCEELVRQLAGTPEETKPVLRTILEAVNAMDEEFLEKTRPVLAALA